MQINASAVIDRSPVGAFQWRVIVLCCLVAMLDGLDIQTVALVAPRIAADWSVPPASFGPVLSASFLGIMFGAIGGGFIGDRFGRRNVLIAAFIFVGLTSLLTAFAANTGHLIICRILTGIGIGGCLPNFAALVTEYVPEKKVGFFVTLVFGTVPIGGVAGGYLAPHIIEAIGWHGVFLAGGVLPLVIAVLLMIGLPESIRFLVATRKNDAKVGAYLQKIDPTYAYAPDHSFTLAEKAPRTPLATLFTDGRLPTTLLLWTVFFFSLAGMYTLISWLPSVFTQLGWPMARAIQSVSYFQLGGIIGGLLFGLLIDRFGPYVVLLPVFLAGFVFTTLIGIAGDVAMQAMTVITLAGAAIVGGQMGMTALAANTYPTAARSTGVGWGLGVGRIGSIFGPTLAGGAIAAGWDRQQLFTAAALPSLVCAACVLGLWLTSRRRRLAVAAHA